MRFQSQRSLTDRVACTSFSEEVSIRAFIKLAITVALLATPAASNAATETTGGAAADHKLDGWGPFKFGTTPEQARAAPGVSWQHVINSSVLVLMFSAPMTTEYGPNTQVSLAFNRDKKLREITLSFTDTKSATDCGRAFQKTLAIFDTNYGAFSPGGNKDLEWSIEDALVRGRWLERTSALSLPGSHSSYWNRTVLPNISGLNVEAETRHALGSSAIELMMYQKDGKDGCHRSIAFQADIPSKEEQEIRFKQSHIPAGMDWHWAELDRPGGAFSNGSPQSVFSFGLAENVRLSSGRFAANVKRPDGASTLHLAGTISDNKISAHLRTSDAIPEGFPASFEGSISMFETDGDSVDTYEIRLTGETPSRSITLGMAAYHRNSSQAPTPKACRRITESVSATRGTVREITYKGLLQAMSCPPP